MCGTLLQAVTSPPPSLLFRGNAGSFNSPVPYDLDAVVSELGEVFQSFGGVDEPEAPDDRDGSVAERRECLDSRRGTHATSILSERHVPNAVQLVLDTPVQTG